MILSQLAIVVWNDQKQLHRFNNNFTKSSESLLSLIKSLARFPLLSLTLTQPGEDSTRSFATEWLPFSAAYMCVLNVVYHN